MSRDIKNTVTKPLHTGLDVLIASGKELDILPRSEKDREVTVFSGPNSWSEKTVRSVTSSDLDEPGRLLKIFSREQWPLVVGVSELRIAIRKKDEPAFRQAFEKVRPWWPTAGQFTLNAIGNNWSGAKSLFSKLMNKLTQNARLIQWQPNEGLLMPALYCPDLKTAKFVLLVMGRLRVCPKCKEIFSPKTDNQDYCKPAHGVAWRTAESRRKKRLREEKARGKQSRK
jgi:hypothetical protein